MKKHLYYFLFFLISTLMVSNSAKAYHIASHMIFANCDSQTFRIQSDTFNSSLRVITYFGDGSTHYDTFFHSGSYGLCYINHTYSTSGVYTVKHILMMAGTGAHLDSATYSDTVNICHIIRYTSYVDNNSDCKLDSGDTYMPHAYYVEIDSAGTAVDTEAGPAFYYSVPASTPIGTIYTFKKITNPAGYKFTCPTSGIKYDTISSSHSGYVAMGFGCDTSGFDLYIYAYMTPGLYGACSHVYVVNNSCTPKAAYVTINYSSKYSYSYTVPSTYSPTTGTGTLTYSLGTVSAGSAKYFTVHFYHSGTLTLGDTVHTTWTVTPFAGDIDTANNVRSSIDTIRSSYDPNEKSVTPQGNIHAGTQLQYTIEFQNTGNDTAHNIYVLDTLSDNLDINSFQVLSATASEVTTITKDASGHNVLRFDMQNIQLLDSAANVNASSGEVIYTINAKAGLANGTKIDNNASIYFDYNPPVITNTVENIIGIPAGVATMSNTAEVNIYPNPTHDALTVKVKSGSYDVVTVTDLMGKVVLQQNIANSQTTISVGTLSPGLYIITLKGTEGIYVTKFQKL